MLRCTLGLIGLSLGLVPWWAQAQQPADPTDVSAVVEAALEGSDAATTSEALAEWLADRVEDPLDLNTAPPEALARLPGLTPILAARIVQRRTSTGPYTARADVLAVEGLDRATYQTVRPFITVATPPSPGARQSIWTSFEGRFIQRVTRRLDVGRGFDADSTRTTYAGTPSRLYTRLLLESHDRLRLNLTLEKDPGEALRWHPGTQTYGFDHVSAHIAARDLGPVTTLVVGDYSAAFGQGLALWRNFSFSKGRDVLAPVVRQGGGLSASASTEENRFFRGLGATLSLRPNVSLTAFGSSRALDASVEHNPPGRATVTSLRTSGLHRTPTELRQKDAVRETLLGGAVEWTPPGLHVGLAGYRGRFDLPLHPPTAPYRLFDFSGRRLAVLTAYASATRGRLHAFGEIAQDGDAWAGTGGLLVDQGTAEAVISLRHFPRHFTALHGQAFGERGTPPQNESGLYAGLRVQPAPEWQLSGYIDQYRFPWLRFAIPRPATGHDFRLLVEHTPRPWLDYALQARSETREEGTVLPLDGRDVEALRPATRQSLRFHGEYVFSARLRFRMRLEGVRHVQAGARRTGLLLYQGVRWRPATWLRLDARWTLFDTDGFDARIYAYEHDLLYTFSIPVFSGRGERHYVLVRAQPTPAVHLELKYGATRYRDVTSVGSGLDVVPGSRIREVRAQVRWSF